MIAKSMLVRNEWYVVAWSTEVGRTLLARRILDEAIVLYRTEAGEAVAFADRCPHRHFPLSLGKLKQDQVVCAYHGFKFDSAGGCVYVPGQAKIPPTAQLRKYPLVERDAFVWVWIGDDALADPARIPSHPWLNHPEWTIVRGMEYLPARYGLLVDNLLDLSHETYLHDGHIGTPEVAETPITTDVDEKMRTVNVRRRMVNAECPPFYARSTGITGRIDRWQDVAYHAPCLYVLHVRIAPTGANASSEGTGREYHVKIIFGITPETETSTFDFWAVARDFALDDQELSDLFAKMNRTIILQDVDALSKLEQVIGRQPEGTREVSIAIDAGGLAARKMLRRMAEAHRDGVNAG